MNTRSNVLEEFNADGVVYPVDTVDYMADEIVRLRDRIRELEAASGEPVAYVLLHTSGYSHDDVEPIGVFLGEDQAKQAHAAHEEPGNCWVVPCPLYSAPPSAAGVSDGSVVDIAMRVRLCAGARVPSACVIGNITADELLTLTGYVIEHSASERREEGGA